MMAANDRSIADVQAEVADEFAFFDDWMDRYNHIIDMGRSAKPLPEELRVAENLVKGCQSQVWLVPSLGEDGKLYFQAGSDALISGGLVTLAVRVYSGHTPDEILTTEPGFIEAIGMNGNITMQRMNGLLAVIKKMKMYALAYKALQQRQDSHGN